MLDNFLPEGPIVRIEKKPAELEGFVSEAAFHAPAARRPVSTTTPPRWRRSDSSATVAWIGSLCVALTIGAVVMPFGSRTAPQDVPPEVRHLRVFMATTPVLIPASAPVRSRRPAASTRARIARAVASEPVRTAKTMTPQKAQTSVARAVNTPAPRTDAMRTVMDRVAPPPVASVAAGHVATTGTIIAPEPAPPIATPSANASLGAVGVAAVVRWMSDEAAVRNVLELYRGAYQQLDAEAARRIWPNLDERRLAKAFSDLESQQLDFEDCRIDINNATSVARCRGRATYVGRIGKRTPQTQQRSWTFQLQKSGGLWAIDSVRSQ